MCNPGSSTFPQDSAGGSSQFIGAPHTSICGATEANEVELKKLIPAFSVLAPNFMM